MRGDRSRIFPVAAAFSLVAGCAQVPKDAGFDDVRSMVADRTGRDVHWRTDGSEDESVDEAIRAMLEDELTTDEAVQVALLNNRRLQATYAALGVAQADLVQAGLLHNPVFSAGVGFVEAGGSPDLLFGVTQDFLDVFLIPLRKRIAAAHFEVTKLQVTGAVLDLAAATRAAYLRAQADLQVREMLQQVVAATEASYEFMRRLHDAGNVRDLDLTNEQALFEQARLDLARAEAAIQRDHERLNALMGLWGSQTQWTMAERLDDIPEEPIDLDHVEQRAIEANLDVAASRSQLEALGERLGLTRSTALVPLLEVGAESEREDGEWDTGPTVVLSLPIFDQGQARVARAEAEVRRQENELLATAVEVRAAARAARQHVVNTREQALHLRDVVLPLRQRIVEQTQLEYNAMQVGAFQLLLARQQQIDAGQRYVESLHDYWLARAHLDQVLAGRIPANNPTADSMMASAAHAVFNTTAQGGH